MIPGCLQSYIRVNVEANLAETTYPANMYMLAPDGQNLGIYPIQVLHGPHIGFFAHIRPIYVPYW